MRLPIVDVYISMWNKGTSLGLEGYILWGGSVEACLRNLQETPFIQHVFNLCQWDCSFVHSPVCSKIAALCDYHSHQYPRIFNSRCTIAVVGMLPHVTFTIRDSHALLQHSCFMTGYSHCLEKQDFFYEETRPLFQHHYTLGTGIWTFSIKLLAYWRMLRWQQRYAMPHSARIASMTDHYSFQRCV